MNPNDPFQEAREKAGRLDCPFQGETVPMILRHADVRQAAKDWRTFSSDAPFRVPIPSEEDVRTMRQLPIETNPPDHTEYRAIVEPFFHRPREESMIRAIEQLVDRMIVEALARKTTEVVREFALPLQSRALTHLLNMPETEAEVWIGWGTHVFKDKSAGENGGTLLERYLNAQFDRAAREPGSDFFSALHEARFRGRALTREEMMGFANVTFAGGRDTIIHTVSTIFWYFSENPQALASLREDPSRILHASEEFFRIVTPLTHIGRVCPVDTQVHGREVQAGGRVSLCWASANRDPQAFEDPEEIRLDRKPNPHLAFGQGPHVCLGAAHARLLIRVLLAKCSERISEVKVLDAVPHVETEERYTRSVGYDSLKVSLTGMQPT